MKGQCLGLNFMFKIVIIFTSLVLKSSSSFCSSGDLVYVIVGYVIGSITVTTFPCLELMQKGYI